MDPAIESSSLADDTRTAEFAGGGSGPRERIVQHEDEEETGLREVIAGIYAGALAELSAQLAG